MYLLAINFTVFHHCLCSISCKVFSYRQCEFDQPLIKQVRDFPVKSSEEGELDDEADWIYRHAFLETPISQQQVGIRHGLMLLWFKMNATYIKSYNSRANVSTPLSCVFIEGGLNGE